MHCSLYDNQIINKDKWDFVLDILCNLIGMMHLLVCKPLPNYHVGYHIFEIICYFNDEIFNLSLIGNNHTSIEQCKYFCTSLNNIGSTISKKRQFTSKKNTIILSSSELITLDNSLSLLSLWPQTVINDKINKILYNELYLMITASRLYINKFIIKNPYYNLPIIKFSSSIFYYFLLNIFNIINPYSTKKSLSDIIQYLTTSIHDYDLPSITKTYISNINIYPYNNYPIRSYLYHLLVWYQSLSTSQINKLNKLSLYKIAYIVIDNTITINNILPKK
jgi:hypothetical protein